MSRFNDLLNRKAVALKYDERQSSAPVVVASGMGHLAEKMVEIANENGVPVYEDNSLATVLSQLNLGAEIPEELYKAVVDIYAYFLHFVPGSQPLEEEEAQEEQAEKDRVEIEAQEAQEDRPEEPDRAEEADLQENEV